MKTNNDFLRWPRRGLSRALLLVGLGLSACDKDTDSGPPPAELQVFAFPNTVEPSGQATIAVSVRDATCTADSPCTLCVGMPGNGDARLFGPAGLGDASAHVITLSAPGPELESLIYVAPDRETSEVVSAALYRGKLECSGSLQLADLLATTTTRILVRNPVSVDAGSEPDAGDADTGGTGGSGGMPDESGGDQDPGAAGAGGTPS